MTAAFISLDTCNLNPVIALADSQASRAIQVRSSTPQIIHQLRELPKELGLVEDFSFEGSEKIVIHIQDAHAIPQAQKSIFELIQYLQRRHGIETVALEGADHHLDSTLLRAFPSRETVRMVLEDYVGKGELSGAVLADALNLSGGYYAGIEDWNLYEDSVSAFLHTVDAQNRLLERWAEYDKKLIQFKTQYYSQKLRDLDARHKQWQENHEDLPSLIEHLSSLKSPEASRYPNLKGVLASLQSEKIKDAKALDREIIELALDIQSRLSEKNVLSEFNRRFQEFQTGENTRGVFAHYLQSVLEGMSRSNEKASVVIGAISGRLSALIRQQAFLRAMKGKDLFEELDRFTREIKDTLIQNENEKLIDQMDRELYLIRQLIRLELSPQEWTELSMGVGPGQEFSSLSSYPAVRDLSREIRNWFGGNDFYDSKKFYGLAHQRDFRFAEKIKALFETRKTQVLIVVAGGFHAQGLRDRLKDLGIAYVPVAPGMDEIPAKTHYQDYMQGHVSWKNYFEIRHGHIDLHEAFNRAMVDRLFDKTGKSREVLKRWRDGLIKALFEQGRIAEANRYTRYLDEKIYEKTDSALLKQTKARWTANFEKFMHQLKLLDKNDRLTELNVLKLLSGPANQVPFAVPASRIPAWWIDPAQRLARKNAPAVEPSPLGRSEVRSFLYPGDNVFRSFLTNFRGDENHIARILDVKPAKVTEWIDANGFRDFAEQAKLAEPDGERTRGRPALYPGFMIFSYLWRTYEGDLGRIAERLDVTTASIRNWQNNHEAAVDRLITRPARFNKNNITSAGARRIRRLFLQNALAVADAKGFTDEEIRVAVESPSLGTIDYWRGGKKGELPTIQQGYAERLAQFVLQGDRGGQNEFTAMARLFGDETLTQEQIITLFSQARRPAARRRASVHAVIRPQITISPASVQHFPWPQIYNDGRARFVSLPDALSQFRLPAGWLENGSRRQVRRLWLPDLGATQGEIRRNLRARFGNLRRKLYESDERLDPDERRVLQARFMENLFVRLRRLHPDAENFESIAGLVGLSEYMIWWWAGTGQNQGPEAIFTGSSIAWDHAVTLATRVLNPAAPTAPWRLIARILGDSRLTQAQINRIWNRRADAGTETVEPPTPAAPRVPSPDSGVEKIVEWPDHYQDGRARFRALPHRFKNTRLSRDEKVQAQHIFLENVFTRLHEQGWENITAIAQALEMDSWTTRWRAKLGQIRNGVWQDATIPLNRAEDLARLVRTGLQGRPSITRIMAHLFGDEHLTEDIIRHIFTLRGTSENGVQATRAPRVPEAGLYEQFREGHISAVDIRRHFLVRAFELADGQGLRDSEIAARTGVTAPTVRFWRGHHHAPPGISLEIALLLARLLLQEQFPRDTDYQLVSRIIGDPEIGWEAVHEIFDEKNNRADDRQAMGDPRITSLDRAFTRGEMPPLEVREQFLANAFAVADDQGITNADIARAEGIYSSTVSWRRHTDGAGISREGALIFARLVYQQNYPLETDEELVGRLLGRLDFGWQDLSANFDAKPLTRSETRAHDQRNRWPEFYDNGSARFVPLSAALTRYVPPAGWLLPGSQPFLRNLWIPSLGVRQATRRERLRASFRQLYTKLYNTNRDLTPDEQKILQARFLENLFVRLRGRYSGEEFLTLPARAVGLKQSTVAWWARTGKNENDPAGHTTFNGATVSWSHAVTLAELALQTPRNTDPWRLLARIFGDSDLTENQIRRIWPRIPESVVDAPVASSRSRRQLSWPADYRDGNTQVLPLPSRLKRTGLNYDERIEAQHIFLENVFTLLYQQGWTNMNEVGRRVGISARTLVWRAKLGQLNNGVWQIATIPQDRAADLARMLSLGIRGRPSSRRMIGAVLGDQNLSQDIIDDIFDTRAAAAASRSTGRPVASASRSQSPDLYQRYQLGQISAVEIRRHFLREAFRLADAEGYRNADIAQVTGVTAPTVNYWRGGHHSPPGISRESALLFARALLLDDHPQETDVRLLSRILGDQRFGWEDIAALFDSRRNRIEERQALDSDVRPLPRTFYEGWMTPLNARAHFLKNAFRVARAAKIRPVDIARAAGVTSGTVGWWRHTPGAGISRDSALLFARLVFGERHPDETDFELLGRLTGGLGFGWEEVTAYFDSKPGPRSELREDDTEPANFLADLNHANWDRIDHAAKRALLLYLFSREQMDPNALLHSPAAFNLPLINGQSLASLLNYYTEQAAKRGYSSAIGLLLFEAGFLTFEGADEIAKHYQLEEWIATKKGEAQFEQFRRLTKDIELNFWLDLYENDQMGFYFMLAKTTNIDPELLVFLVSEQFEKKNHIKKTSSYHWDFLRRLEPHFARFWNYKEFLPAEKGQKKVYPLRDILLSQIKDRIMKELVKKAEADRSRISAKLKEEVRLKKRAAQNLIETTAFHALILAQEIFHELEAKASSKEAREIYAALAGYYRELETINYQQYLNLQQPNLGHKKDGVAQELKLYQLDGIHFANKGGRVLIGDEMGLGKSVQTLGVAQAAKAKRVVILAPSSILENWNSVELRKWLPNVAPLEERMGDADTRDFYAILPAGTIGGRTRVERLRDAKRNARFILINHDALGSDKGRDEIVREINDWDPDLIVLDEAHHFKNDEAKRTRSYMNLGTPRSRMIAISGTPIVNKTLDLWTLLHQMDPDYDNFKTKEEFKAYYHGLIGRVQLYIELRQKGLFKRRKKAEVLDNLKELHKLQYLDAEPDDEHRDEVFVWQQLFEKSKKEDPKKMLYFLSKMRQAALDRDFLPDEKNGQKKAYGPLNPYGDPQTNPHYPYRYPHPMRLKKIVAQVAEILRDPNQRHRNIFIVSEFHHPIRRLHRMLVDEFGIDMVATLQHPEKDEPIDLDERLGVVEKFNDREKSKSRILLATLGTGGEGLNMTGASIFIAIDSPLTYVKLAQGIDRLHRIGQEHDVWAFLYRAFGTIEDVIAARLAWKRGLKEEVLDGELDIQRIEESVAQDVQRVLEHVRYLMRIRAHLQDLYNAGNRGDWRAAMQGWNKRAQEYSDNVERLAAFPIAQLLWLFLFRLHRSREVEFRKDDKILFAPAGPATDIRALHTLLKHLTRATGLGLNDFHYVLADFAENMRAVADPILTDIGVHDDRRVWQSWNLVEDELPEEEHDWTIGSELWHYVGNLNSKGVSQRNWMLAQLVKTTKVGGHVLIWVHSGRFGDRRRDFLRQFGLEVLYDEGLNKDNLPAARQKTLSKMSFILAKRVAKVDLSVERLKRLDPNGLEITNAKRMSLLRGNPHETLSLLEFGPDLQATASIAAFADEDDMVQVQERPPLDEEYSEEEKRLESATNELYELLKAKNHNDKTVSRIETLVQQIIDIQPIESILRGIRRVLVSALQGSLKKFENRINTGILRNLDAELRDIESYTKPLKVKRPTKGPPKGGPEPPEGPREPKPLRKDMIEGGALLKLFRDQGFHFKMADVSMPHYSLDMSLDEASKTFWVNSDLVDIRGVPEAEREDFIRQRSQILNLKSFMHLDALFPDDRLEAAFAGLDRLQKTLALLRKNNTDLDLVNRLNLDAQWQLFLFVMKLRDMASLDSRVERFQSEKNKTTESYKAFIESYRNTSSLIPFTEEVNRDKVREIEQFLNDQLGAISIGAVASSAAPAEEEPAEVQAPGDDQAWIEDFNKRHAKTFRVILGAETYDGGDLSLVKSFELGATAFDISIVHRDPQGRMKTLARLGEGAALPVSEDFWQVQWQELEYPNFAGTYERSVRKLGELTREAVIGKSDMFSSARIESKDANEGLILISSDAPSGEALLVRAIHENAIGIFKLINGKLEGNYLKPLTVLDISGTAPEGGVIRVEHTEVTVNKGAAVFFRAQAVGFGVNKIYRAKFNADAPAPPRSELRSVTEAAVGIGTGDRSKTYAAAHTAERWIRRMGLHPFQKEMRSVFSDMLADGSLMAAVTGADAPLSRSYFVLDEVLRETGLSRDQYDVLSRRIFQDSLGQLGVAIERKDITRLAPVIFYAPEVKDMMTEFIESVSDTVRAQPALDEKNFRFHLVFKDKREMDELLRALKTESHSFVKKYYLPKAASGWNKVVRELNAHVFENDAVSDAYGVFFPNDGLVAMASSLARERLVRSDVPVHYSFALVPRLALYFARTDASAINAVSLVQALPDFGSSLEFRAGGGIRVLAAVLRLMAETRERFAISA